jgi:hypothetical protein
LASAATKEAEGKLPLEFCMDQASCWEHLHEMHPSTPNKWQGFVVRGQHFAGFSDREVMTYGIAVHESTNPYDKNAVRVYAVTTKEASPRNPDAPERIYYQAVGYVAKEYAGQAAKMITDRQDEVNAAVPVYRVRYKNDHTIVELPRNEE